MAGEEKKYLVDNLDRVQERLIELGANAIGEGSSEHYYAAQPGNDVVKLVIGPTKHEIHRLESHEGRFKLVESIPVKDKKAGFNWLKDHGFNQVNEIQMHHRDYRFMGGIVGLYTINGDLRSVILEYEPGGHSKVERLLALNRAKVIELPYNKLLEQEGRLSLKNI